MFQVRVPKKDRRGYGKCLNVTDRNQCGDGAAGLYISNRRNRVFGSETEKQPACDAISAFHAAAERAGGATLCGIDIGGTDIKVVGIQNGHIAAGEGIRLESRRNDRMEQLIGPVLLMAGVVRAAMSLPNTPEAQALRERMLGKGVSDEAMQSAVDTCRAVYGEPLLLDGIGVCFPDVVIEDRIVGGETYKTRGIRNASPDYEAEFLRLAGLREMLLKHCRPGGTVHMANDGSLAAYTAAVELAHSEQALSVANGVFAHTLGTELGTGWIDETGAIPQIPLEVYNCIIDLGNRSARAYHELDVRSVILNTGLPARCRSTAARAALTVLRSASFRKRRPRGTTICLIKDFLRRVRAAYSSV